MKSSFGESLSNLLRIFNINGSKLAQGIKIDQSLVYKWLRGERIPAYDSNYIELITNYLSENLNANPHIIRRITEFFPDCEDPLDSVDFKLKIHNTLSQAQILSFASKDNEKEVSKGYSCIKTDGLGSGYQKEKDTVKIITGMKALLDSTIELISKASETHPCKKPILILLNSNMANLDQYSGMSMRWKTALLDAMQKGWEVILLIRLNDNVTRTIMLVEDILATLSTNRVHVFFINACCDTYAGNDLVIVPNVGALFLFSCYIKDHIDSAFLFETLESIELLTGHFYQFCSSAKPLYISYPSQKYIEFQKLFTHAEEEPGDRLVFKGGHSTIIVPADLYEEYLIQTVKRREEIYQRLDLHRKRIRAFEAQIKSNKFREIWFKDSILRLIFEKEKEQYIPGSYVPSKEVIISYLKSIIERLQEYENYEVALVEKKDYEDINNVSWMIKGNSYVYLEVTDITSELNCAINEESIVKAFRQHFLNSWDNIPSVDKDKGRVIGWLNSLMNEML